MLWYHDHTMGINRLNMVAGLMGLYLIRDEVEDSIHLPSGPYEVPLVICDRMFDHEAQLTYPVSLDPAAPWVPEFFGDAFLVNGKLLPFLEVESRKYRFRIVNTSNARFFNLSLEGDQEFQQVGTDQGLLPAPVSLKLLTLAPGERADILIDFAENGAGKRVVMKNDVLPLMQFRVIPSRQKDIISSLPRSLRPVPRIPEGEAVRTRLLTMEEVANDLGEMQRMLLNGKHWHDPVTERPMLDTVEIWNLVNMTEDVHPIHLHLVRFQILDRRAFNVYRYQLNGEFVYDGPALPPDPNEGGWKDTVRAFPEMVTRIIVRFEGYTGRYVWHCHILEHEDNDMMRPYDVIPNPNSATFLK